MKLVPDWRECWKWHSMHAMGGTIGALIYAWNAMPERMKAEFPARWVILLAVVMLAGGMIARLRDQAKPTVRPPVTVPPAQGGTP